MRLYGDADLSIWTEPGWGANLVDWAEAVKTAHGSGWLRSRIREDQVKTLHEVDSLPALLDRCGSRWCEPQSTATKEGLDESGYEEDGYYDADGHFHPYDEGEEEEHNDEDDGDEEKTTKRARFTAAVRRGGADWRAYFAAHPELHGNPWNLWLPAGQAEEPLTKVLELRADGNFYLWAASTDSMKYLIAFATS